MFVDLSAVRHVAQVLAGHGGQVVLQSPLGGLFEDAFVRRILEAGLVVTYARPFMGSQGYGSVPRDWVRAEHRKLHDFLLERRSSYYAHTDADSAQEHRRHVSASQGWIHVAEPDPLTHEQLLELAELTEKLQRDIRTRLEKARRAAERASDAHAVHTPVPPSKRNEAD